MRGELDVIAVTPHVRVFFEICGPVFFSVGVVPEADRHRRERSRAYELAFGAAYRLALLIEHFNFHSQTPALNFAAPYRQNRIAEHEG